MVYAVQNYKVYFGLYPSSGIYDKNHSVSETGSVSVLRWMGQDRPTQLGPLERASLNHWIRNVVIFCHIYQTMDKVQNKHYSSVRHEVKICNKIKTRVEL
jgi:hypothetical protein